MSKGKRKVFSGRIDTIDFANVHKGFLTKGIIPKSRSHLLSLVFKLASRSFINEPSFVPITNKEDAEAFITKHNLDDKVDEFTIDLHSLEQQAIEKFPDEVKNRADEILKQLEGGK